MMNRLSIIILSVIIIACLPWSCKKAGTADQIPPDQETKDLTIFIVNDVHAQLDNFSKIKYIVENEKLNTHVLVVCGGDIFSGNPVVDNYTEKGRPIIDIMNSVGFDITVLGNHEFDYGIEALGDNMLASQFDWVCANLNSDPSLHHQSYKTLSVDGFRVTFLGLIETNGKPNATIPLTHPWKVEGLIFQPILDVINQYSDLKEAENADMYIALTHIGSWPDIYVANNYPYFDMIIGGHTHSLSDTVVNGIPIFRAGDYLHYLGKIMIEFTEDQIQDIDFELINLDEFNDRDAELQQSIDQYNTSMPYLDDVIGYASTHHYKNYNLGCFYTDALRSQLQVDVTFQNTGGIRSDLDEGDITKREIYAISPFNNGTVIYTMSVAEIKQFLVGSGSGFYYSGIELGQSGNEVIIKNMDGEVLQDPVNLTVGLNDYIPAVFDMYFPSIANGEIQPFTDAETIIHYLENNPQPVNYENCDRYFKYLSK